MRKRRQKRQRTVSDTVHFLVKVEGVTDPYPVTLKATHRQGEHKVTLKPAEWEPTEPSSFFPGKRVLREKHPIGIPLRRIGSNVVVLLRGREVFADVGNPTVYVKRVRAETFVNPRGMTSLFTLVDRAQLPADAGGY